jgi:hypothetical protein
MYARLFYLLKDLRSLKVFAVQQRKMGLSRFPDAFEGVIPVLIICTALSIAMVRNILISLLRKMGLKLITEQPELAQSARSFAYAEEEAAELDSGLSQLAMTTEEIGDRLPVSLFQVSSSSSSCSCSDSDCSCFCSDGNDVSECVVCLRKFHGGEEIRTLPCGHVFHKICVDKWILDYENMTCPLCRVCLVFPVEDELRRSRELVMRF